MCQYTLYDHMPLLWLFYYPSSRLPTDYGLQYFSLFSRPHGLRQSLCCSEFILWAFFPTALFSSAKLHVDPVIPLISLAILLLSNLIGLSMFVLFFSFLILEYRLLGIPGVINGCPDDSRSKAKTNPTVVGQAPEIVG